MIFNVSSDGTVEGLYTDKIDLHRLGRLSIYRISEIEYSYSEQGWVVYLEGLKKIAGPFKNREDAKKAEREYIEEHVL